MTERFFYGGQAVLQGVMMRGLHQATVAVRAPDGSIVLRHRALNAARRARWERLPFLRGIQLLGDALLIGVWALSLSASIANGEDEQPLSKGALGMMMATSLGLAIALFFLLPMLIASGISPFLFGFLGDEGLRTLARELVEGIIRLAIMIGYIVLAGRMEDIKCVFGYHGAEHKAVAAYEAGCPLKVEEVQRFSTIHPRCGTTLLLVVVALSIPAFALLGGLPFWARMLSRIVFVPLIAAMAFELLRLAARRYERPFIRRLMAPALALQRLTTREPDNSMVEVAIAALIPVLQADAREVPGSELRASRVERPGLETP